MCKEHLSTQPVFKDSPFATYLTAGMIAEATWYGFDDYFCLHSSYSSTNVLAICFVDMLVKRSVYYTTNNCGIST